MQIFLAEKHLVNILQKNVVTEKLRKGIEAATALHKNVTLIPVSRYLSHSKLFLMPTTWKELDWRLGSSSQRRPREQPA